MNPSLLYEVLNLSIGDQRYDEILGQIRGDAYLRAQMWADAEHGFDEPPGKVWTVVVVRDHGRWVPAAWAAATVQHHGGQPVLRCSDNYERSGRGRRLGLYPMAYRHRHVTVVAPSPYPALTYLFAGPLTLHEADGWWELRRRPTVVVDGPGGTASGYPQPSWTPSRPGHSPPEPSPVSPPATRSPLPAVPGWTTAPPAPPYRAYAVRHGTRR
jgi:hypothetical protein